MTTAPAATPNSYRTGPDEHGRFGIFGGRFVAETLMPLILEVERAYNEAKADPAFEAEFRSLLANPDLDDYIVRTRPSTAPASHGVARSRPAT